MKSELYSLNTGDNVYLHFLDFKTLFRHVGRSF